MTSKVAVITGASRGIGRACAEHLASDGWTVAIGYRSSETDAKETLEALEAAGTPGLAVHLDVTDAQSVQEAFRRVTDEAGNVTGLVNNAGMSRDGLLIKYPLDIYEQTMATNMRGAFLCAQAALRGMLREKWGRIINVASVAGMLPAVAGHTLYAASKAFVIKFSEALALETMRHGVKVTASCPGFTLSEFHDVTGTREQVSKMPPFMWLAADAVARESYDAVMRGAPVYVPGWQYRAMTTAGRVLPQSLVWALMKRNASRFRRV